MTDAADSTFAAAAASRLSGSVALVTGASRGIGKAIGIALVEAGAAVALCARSADALDAVAAEITANGGTALAIASDVTEDGTPDRILASVENELGRVGILVNAAGISPSYTRIEQIKVEDWDSIMATNVRAPFLFSQAVGARMVENGSGSIINIASIGGIVALPRLAAYCAAKAALISLTRVMAVEWAPHGVRVNAIAPAYVRTSMTEGILNRPDIRASLLEQTPIGRFASPEEIAPMAVYLASEDASYVTGQSFNIDGGWTAR